MKKILFLHSGAEMYGADQILLKIVSNINKEKYKPIVILPNYGPLEEEFKKNKIDCRIVSYPILRRKYFNFIGIIQFIKEYRKSSKKILSIINKEKIDVLYCNTLAVLEGTYIKNHSNIIYISHIHEMLENPKIVAKFLYKRQLKCCNKMIVVSNAVKKHIESITNKYTEKIVVIHNGIENFYNIQLKSDEFRKKYNIPKKAIVVAFVGRINAIKGQSHFIEAIDMLSKKNKNVYGVLIGDAFPGQEWRVKDLIKNIKERNNSNIIYCGFIKEVQKMYNSFDLLVLPSIQKDSFPTVVLEAMSCGVPCVAYKCGGVEEMIQNGENGYLIEQGDIQELALSIEKIINNKSILRNMSKACFEKYNILYTINMFAKKINEMIDNMMGDKDEQ